MDLSPAALIVLAAGYAGAAVALTRGVFRGTVAAVGTLTGFALMLGAAGVYPVLRRWLRMRPAPLVMGGALGTLLAGSAAAVASALATM